MAIDEQGVFTDRVRLRRFQFSIRALFALLAIVSLVIVAIQFGWPRRTVTTLLTVPAMDVRIYEPHIDVMAKVSDSIIELPIDRRTNSIIVSAQARNIGGATRAVEQLIVDPRPVFAASSLGITIQEAQELLMSP